MPKIRHYRVTQTREVKVTANSSIDAARIADVAFNDGQNSDNGVKASAKIEGIWGNTTSAVRTTDISTHEEI